MKCYLNNKTIHIYPIFLKKLGKGSEGVVYKYKDKALKINYDKRTYPVQNFKTMTYLDTSCIILPKELVYNKDMNLMWYTKEYIKPKNKEEFYNLNKYDFLQLLYKLREELLYVSKSKLYLRDWLDVNFMYDGKIRIIDPGRYTLGTYNDVEGITKLNLEQLVEFCFREMFSDSLFFKGDYYKKSKMTENLYSKYESSNFDDVISFFEEDMKECTVVNEYIKKYN